MPSQGLPRNEDLFAHIFDPPFFEASQKPALARYAQSMAAEYAHSLPPPLRDWEPDFRHCHVSSRGSKVVSFFCSSTTYSVSRKAIISVSKMTCFLRPNTAKQSQPSLPEARTYWLYRHEHFDVILTNQWGIMPLRRPQIPCSSV